MILNKRGAAGISTAVKVLISVILGGLILTSTFFLINHNLKDKFINDYKKQENQKDVHIVENDDSTINNIIGDINKDKQVDSNDITYLNNYINNITGYNVSLGDGDLDKNDTIDKYDIEYLKILINKFKYEKYNHNSSSVNHGKFNNKIPIGAIYKSANGNTLNGGDYFPTVSSSGDIYIYNDYEYCFNCELTDHSGWSSSPSLDGWGVKYTGSSNSPLEILETINKKPIKSLKNTFKEYGLFTCPILPKQVINMQKFAFNSAIQEIPFIPNKVENISEAFAGIFGSTEAYIEVPDSVVDVHSAFSHSQGMKGVIKFNNIIDNSKNAFFNSGNTHKSILLITDNKNTYIKDYFNKLIQESNHQDYVYYVDFNSSYNHNANSLHPGRNSNRIPAGGEYNGKTDYFPDTCKNEDVFIYHNYRYKYLTNSVMNNTNGWEATYIGLEEKPGPILESINKSPVISLYGTFYKNKAIKYAPEIPINVKNMFVAFSDCSSLIMAPNIPENVDDIAKCFYNCPNLKGTINIDANFTDYTRINDCFKNAGKAKKSIILTTSKNTQKQIETLDRLTETNIDGNVIIDSELSVGYDHNAPELHPGKYNNKLPVGATYNGATDVFPTSCAHGDVLEYKNYRYMYIVDSTWQGWSVYYNGSEPNPPPIFESINNKPVVSMQNCFCFKFNLVSSPEIPLTVTDISGCYDKCSNLKTMVQIPANIKKIQNCFKDCTSLSGKIIINTTLDNKKYNADAAFSFAGNANNPIILTTKNKTKEQIEMLKILAATSYNNSVIVDSELR